ncbi:hypothetical protein HanIR_Chr11g0521641 [Helianthus annuus]|nr:hypothetical protein HanIR_Chr11g0521641 [Helianthus annuus]
MRIQIAFSTTEVHLTSWVHLGCEIATNEDEPIMGFAHGVRRRREWRPPWRSIETAPNATGKIEWQLPWRNTSPNADGRLEWRPPWPITENLLITSLRTRIVLSGRECYVPVVVEFYFYFSM